MITKRFKLFIILKILIAPISDPKTKGSSYLHNMNLNANDDNHQDAKEIPSPHKRGFKKVYEEFKTYPDPKIATEDLRNLGWLCLKLRMKFEI